MNKIRQLAYEQGLYASGTPDSWDEEALEKFGRAVAAMCEKACIDIHESAQNTAKSEFVTPTGKDIHIAMSMGALSCAGAIAHLFDENPNDYFSEV